ncbi:type IV secretory system conjugative DNA transfer family protein [Bifidobacterium psychraerophilum]|uniref:type IV secretory system conjugative DNA transfer family protein n=1 Tax=Bifidobacterium psychraerophilum TaxID=218140 RepID=UPI003114F3FF
MASNNRRSQPQAYSDTTILIVGGLAVAAAAAWTTWVAWHLGMLIQDRHMPHVGMGTLLSGLFHGTIAWPGVAGWIMVAVQIAVYTALIALFLMIRAAHTGGRTRIDDKARYLGRGRDIASLTRKQVARVAKRLGVTSDAVGLTLGRHIPSGKTLYMTWEDTLLTVAGPRTGKTTCLVIPSILDAPGAVVATSNKPDVIQAIRAPRSVKGTVWAFDPQHISDEARTWWWNPLSYVTDDTKALQMAGYFAAATTDPNAKRDAFFDTAAESLLSYLLLACALSDQPITQVWHWLTNTNDTSPVDILRQGGYPLLADSLEAVIEYPDKQKQGVYGSAQNLCRVLTSPTITAWVTDTGEGLPCLDVHRFVGSNDTLCLMSREGVGTAGALTLAITAAVAEAGEERARREGGRLHVPLVMVLDEAANICRWRELPDLYSHYGSRGIIILTFLQSWSQGEQAWGDKGLEKMYSAANMAVYIGGVKEEPFLRSMSGLLGEYEYVSRQVGYSRGEGSSTMSITRDHILDIDDLAALPRGRALLMSSGNRPVLMRTIPWMDRPDAKEVIEQQEKERQHGLG